MKRAHKKALVVVVAAGIVAIAAAVFFLWGPSASKEAPKLYGVWRMATYNKTSTGLSLTGFVEFSEKTLTHYVIINGELRPPYTEAITWDFQDGKLCCYVGEEHSRNKTFLSKLSDPNPTSDEMQLAITFVDDNTIRVESTVTSGKTTTTHVDTAVRSSPTELETAFTKRLTYEELDARYAARTTEPREEPGSGVASQPVNENDPLEPAE